MERLLDGSLKVSSDHDLPLPTQNGPVCMFCDRPIIDGETCPCREPQDGPAIIEEDEEYDGSLFI